MASQTPPTRPKKVLMLTNKDHGQSNCFLATAHAMLMIDPTAEVHFATFKGFESFIDGANENIQRSSPGANGIIYHTVQGLSMPEGMDNHFERLQIPRKDKYLPLSYLTGPLTTKNTMAAIRDTVAILIPYTGPEITEIYESCVDIIKKVQADIIILDCLFTPGLTALEHLGLPYVCLSPNTVKDFSMNSQTRVTRMRFPGIFSGFQYPVPIYYWPFNMFYVMYAISIYLKDEGRKATEAYLKEKTGADLVTLLKIVNKPPPGLKILVGSLPEFDFPLNQPDHLIPCGPILRIAPPLSESDPELEKWLIKGPTVYINLGSICHIEEHQALEMAVAVRRLLDAGAKQNPNGPHLQILWKLRKYGEWEHGPGSKFHELLGKEVEEDRIRTVHWLQAEPVSVLMSGHIVCQVHHGGSNSFHEALKYVLPLCF